MARARRLHAAAVRLAVQHVVPNGARRLPDAAELPAAAARFRQLSRRSQFLGAVPADLRQQRRGRGARHGRPARHLHARRLRLRAAQVSGARQPVLRDADRPPVPGAGHDHPDLSRLRAGRAPEPADRACAHVSHLELRRLPRAAVHALAAEGARGGGAHGRRRLPQDLFPHLAAPTAAGPGRARHHHLHPDLELLLSGARAARTAERDDAARSPWTFCAATWAPATSRSSWRR